MQPKKQMFKERGEQRCGISHSMRRMLISVRRRDIRVSLRSASTL